MFPPGSRLEESFRMTTVTVQNSKFAGSLQVDDQITAITGPLQFTQPGSQLGDEFLPFPLKQLFLTEDSGTVAGLLVSIVT